MLTALRAVYRLYDDCRSVEYDSVTERAITVVIEHCMRCSQHLSV